MKKTIIDSKALRKKMIDKDIKSITELAMRSGVSKPTIYEYINGKSPFATAFLKLCISLDVVPDEILTMDGDLNSQKEHA